MINNTNWQTMARKWLEGIITGICIALTVALVQPLVVGDDGWFQVGALLLAITLVCSIQLALSYWNRPRQ